MSVRKEMGNLPKLFFFSTGTLFQLMLNVLFVNLLLFCNIFFQIIRGYLCIQNNKVLDFLTGWYVWFCSVCRLHPEVMVQESMSWLFLALMPNGKTLMVYQLPWQELGPTVTFFEDFLHQHSWGILLLDFFLM